MTLVAQPSLTKDTPTKEIISEDTTTKESTDESLYDKYDDVEIGQVDLENGSTKSAGSCNRGCLTYKSYQAKNAAFSAYSCNALVCFLVVNGALSICSINGIGSLFSINSVLSIGSVNSFMAIGCHGGFMEICF